EIAAVGQLAAGELAHSDHQKLAASRRDAAARQVGPRQIEPRFDAHLGELGERRVGLRRSDLFGQIEQADVDQLAVLKASQRVEILLDVMALPFGGDVAADLGQLGAQLVARQDEYVRIAEDRLDQPRMGSQIARQVFRRGEQSGEAVDQLGTVDEQSVEE